MKVDRFRALMLTSVLLLLGVATAQQTVRAQGRGDDINLQKFSPEGEVFSVDMPRDPKVEESEEPYHRMTITTRLYLSANDRGPVFAVASLRGIKVDPRMYSEVQRFNSYDDAFRHWFPQKVRGKNAVAKFTLVGDKTLNQNPGREYRVTIGDLTGTAQMYLGRRFYAVVVLNTKKDDELAERFLSSLVLPEKSAPPQPTLAGAPGGDTPVVRQPRNEKTEESAKTESAVATAETKPSEATPSEKPAGEKAPISGGVLNGKAIYLPQPDYPPIAAQAKASGTVAVQVVIDEVGNVISAHAVSGHPLLQAASVAAARQARFTPTSLMGEPVKVTGVLTYNFVAR
jgi:TonB family protein